MFAKLGIAEYAENFTKEGIDLEALAMCTEDDLKDGGLPVEPRKKLLDFLADRNTPGQSAEISGLEKFQQQSVESEVKYMFGPAGTGQPSVTYPVNPAPKTCFSSTLAYFPAVIIWSPGSDNKRLFFSIQNRNGFRQF